MEDEDAVSRASDLDWQNFDMDASQLPSPDPQMFEQFSMMSDEGSAGGAVPAPSNSVALAEAGSASPTPEDALQIFEHAELDKTNMAAFLASVREEGATVTPARLLAAVQNADKCQVNPGANITTGPDVFHIVSSPPQASKTAYLMLLCLKDAIRHRMPSVVMVMNKKTELERMERSLNHSSDFFAEYCRAIATLQTPGIRAIYPIGGNDRTDEYERCLKRWHKRDSDECPIYFFLFNDNKLILLATVIDKVRNIVGVDAKGRVRLAFRHDEGDQISKTCDRSSVSEKSLMGTGVLANGLLDKLSSLTFVTSTLPSMILVPVPLGNRRPIFTELEPSRNYVGYKESDKESNRTGLRKTIERLEMNSASEYTKFVSEQAGAHAGMVFMGGSTKAGRKERAREAAIEYKTIEGWVTTAWSSDELHVCAADPTVISVLQGATWTDEEKHVFDQTHADTGVMYFHSDTSHGKKGISDYPALISFLIERLPPNYLKTILFAKQMADRGTSICSTDHKHHLGSMYVSFSKNSSDEYMRQSAGRLPQMIVPQPEMDATIYLCGTAATHETHQLAVQNCVFASDYLKKHFNEGTASLDDTLKEFGDKVEAARCDSVQNETSGAMMFVTSTVARGTLSTKIKKKAKQVERVAKKRRVKIHHTYPFGAQEETADVPVQQNTETPEAQAMAREEEAAAQNTETPEAQAMAREEEAAAPAAVPVQQNTETPEAQAAPVVDPPVVQPPVQDEASAFPPPLQIGEIGAPELPLLRFPPLPPLTMMQPEPPVQQNVVRHPLQPIVRQPTAGPRAPSEVRHPLQPIVRQPTAGPRAPSAVRHPLQPIVRQPTAGPRAPTGDPALDMEELMLDNLRDFIVIIKWVLEDADEDSRMDGVGVHKMAREIKAKAHYYETMGAKVPAIEVVKYVGQEASNELAEAKVVFEANGKGGGVFKKIKAMRDGTSISQGGGDA